MWVLSPAVSDQGVKLITHFYLVLRLRLSGAIQGHLYLLHTDFIKKSLFCGKRSGKYLQQMSSLWSPDFLLYICVTKKHACMLYE